MWHEGHSRTSPRGGEYAYFYHLHLDQAELEANGNRPAEGKEVVFRVRGKARPMLVLSQTGKVSGVIWYLVVKLTTHGLAKNGDLKPRHVLVGPLSKDDTTVSYADCMPLHYPHNLLCERGEPGQLNRLAFSALMKHIQRTVLG
jgi:hypothetical protein